VTAPTYFSAIPILRSFGVEFVEIAQDAEGLDVETLALRLREREQQGLAPPKFIYNVPDFHNPTGVTMSRARREALVELATRKQIAIIEDSPYRRLRFEGATEPSLKALDREGVVFALGTFSKLLAPGLRIGWIGGAETMLARMARLKSDGGTCPLTQRIVFEFLQNGGLDPHLVRAREAYHSHRDLMAAGLGRELPDVRFTLPLGGYYLWLEFPVGIDTNVLSERAYEAGVSVIPGDPFYAAGDAGSAKSLGIPKRYMRLAYSHATPEQIEKGVKLLAAAYRSMN
jgi:2-aminoadipate transaminase